MLCYYWVTKGITWGETARDGGGELGREHILEIYQNERDRKKSYGIE